MPGAEAVGLLPDEPGGYNGYQALFGAKYVNPAITGGNAAVNNLDGNPIDCAAINSTDFADGTHTFTAAAGVSPFGDGTTYSDETTTYYWAVLPASAVDGSDALPLDLPNSAKGCFQK